MTIKSSRWGPVFLGLAKLCVIATSACGRTFVVVPQPAGQYTATVTLYAIHRGDEVRVTFYFDTIVPVDTVERVDTAWVEGSRTIVRLDTLLRVDTLRTVVTDTLVVRETVLRIDTIRVPVTDTQVRVDTILRVDTVRVTATDTVVRTVRVPGRRQLFVPPGHYPPSGQCRVWIHDLPPGQQSAASACDELGDMPEGAFVLFGGDAWDFNYDWVAEAEANPGTVSPEIIGLKRRNCGHAEDRTRDGPVGDSIFRPGQATEFAVNRPCACE